MTNPYTLTFGKEPREIITRSSQEQKVLNAFLADPPNTQAFMITGMRGTGKTVFLSKIQKEFRSLDDWIVVELNPQRDMLLELASKLSSNDTMAKIFQASKINLSFFGFGLEVSGATPISDIEVALERMIESLAKKGKHLLIAIDEVSSTEQMRIFSAAFQILIRKDLPVFLLMTGLYENINALQNEKNLTFLYRTPKIELKALNLGTIADNYRDVLSVDDAIALDMAKLTRGYAFAFQVLGYFSWIHSGDSKKSIAAFKQYLDDYVYDKVWAELSHKDRLILNAAANTPTGKILDIRKRLGMETNAFNPYRSRLIKRGILSGEERGYLKFVLPLFERYAIEHFED